MACETDQRGCETSSAGVIDETLAVLLSRGCFESYSRQGILQTAPMNS